MKPKISEYITLDELRELFEIRGSDVVWKVARSNNKILPGTVAGAMHTGGYRVVQLSCKTGKVYIPVHHIAFALHHRRWATSILDHRDTNRVNNNPKNLREANDSSNNWNSQTRKDNKTGVKGVFYRTGRKKPYNVQVKAKNILVFSGDFTTLEEATIAVQQARTKHHGEFARHA